jgi:hypothetical protein
MKNIFYFLALLLLPAYGFAEETLEQKVQNKLNDKTIEDPYIRFRIVNDTVANNISELSFEEAKQIYYDILLSFVEKKVNDDYKRDKAKGTIFTNIFWIHNLYGYPGDSKANDAFLKKIVENAELLKNDTARANVYRGYGAFQSAIGNIPVSHEYYYKAIALYESLRYYERVFLCLYNIAEKMSETRNTAAMRKVIEQMQYYMELPSVDVSVRSLYHFYAARGVYYGILFENYPEIIAYNDSALMDNLNTIHLLENNEIKSSIIYYAYYNTAVCYNKSYPDQYDSVYYFLDKALEYKTGYKYVDAELEINVYIFYAKLHFAQKKYEQAEKDMLYALSLLEELNNNNTAMEYTEAYKFLAMYYETVNRPDEALKYHKLLLENEAKRYDNDKIVTMDDMLVKYETEKKEEQIDRLAEQNQTAQKILILTISLIAVLLITLLLFIHFYRLRKKNLEQSIYESALLAELKQTELEQNQKEKEALQQQYNKLEAQANRNKEKAQPYIAELKRIKQQLEQKPTKTIIGKLTEWISKSVIEKSKKDLYIQQLSELDVDMLEQDYLFANGKLSTMEKKYIICFTIGMDVKDMGILFNVESGSVRTVRYRIKKKFGDENTFKFLL